VPSHAPHSAPAFQIIDLDVAFHFNVVFSCSPVASKGKCNVDKNAAASRMSMIMSYRSKYW
jgi:hypothetical protein